jgi:hypothetical protein
MEHPFYVIDDKEKVIPIKQLQCAIPFGFRALEDGKTFIGISCNRRDPVHVDNAIQELRAELAKYGYSVIAGHAPTETKEEVLSCASGMLNEAL